MSAMKRTRPPCFVSPAAVPAASPASKSASGSCSRWYLYAGLGYTTVNEAAVPILSAKHTHEELRDTPIVDKACCVLMANNEILLDLIEQGELERARHVAAWNIWAAKAYSTCGPGGQVFW
jgi:formylmethanofuran dehydrogenase subunit A